MKIVNRVGLEVEYFLFDKNNTLVYPCKYGFETDDFVLLGEFRCEPGKTRHETIGNFFNEFSRIRQKVKDAGLAMAVGYQEITPELRAEVLRNMGTKEIADTKNIYNTNILTLSDDVIEDGKIVSCKISTGFHIHFSRHVEFQMKYWDGESHGKEKTVSEKLSIITPKQKKFIIRKMDTCVLPNYKFPVQLKYRNKGFYEDKPWGFEYRSLPMCNKILELKELERVVNAAFSFLEQLEK
jgi:hypothetical protein